MEPAAARKVEGRAGDGAPGRLHVAPRLLEIVRPDDYERRRRATAVAIDPDIDSGALDAIVGGPVVDARPAERCLEKAAAGGTVGAWKLQIVDPVLARHRALLLRVFFLCSSLSSGRPQ